LTLASTPVVVAPIGPMSRRLRLFLSHLLISALAVGTVTALVVLVWYPRPLFSLQGALFILAMVAFVDVVIGPLITLIIGSPKKGRRELIRDLTVIGIIQLAALMYGTHSLFVARPAFVVYSADRFDSVAANEVVRNAELSYRDPQFASTPIFRPLWTVARPSDSVEERNRMLFSAVQGGSDLKDYPALYEVWPPNRTVVAAKLKPLRELMDLSREGNDAGLNAMRISGLKEGELSYVPLMGREKIGVVILNSKTLSIVLASDAAPRY
jgi:hypothetical protein